MKNIRTQNLMRGLLTAAVLGTALTIPDAACWAQLSVTAGQTKTGVFNPVLNMVSFASYLMGAYFGFVGLVKAKKHTENAQSNPLAPALGHLGVGAALLALPSLMGVLTSTASGTLSGTATFNQFGF